MLFVAFVFVDALGVFLLPSFVLVVVPDSVAQLFIRAIDLTDRMARMASEPVLGSSVDGGARRPLLDCMGLVTERTEPWLGSGTESKVEALSELKRARDSRGLEGSGATKQ